MKCPCYKCITLPICMTKQFLILKTECPLIDAYIHIDLDNYEFMYRIKKLKYIFKRKKIT